MSKKNIPNFKNIEILEDTVSNFIVKKEPKNINSVMDTFTLWLLPIFILPFLLLTVKISLFYLIFLISLFAFLFIIIFIYSMQESKGVCLFLENKKIRLDFLYPMGIKKEKAQILDIDENTIIDVYEIDKAKISNPWNKVKNNYFEVIIITGKYSKNNPCILVDKITLKEADYLAEKIKFFMKVGD